MHRSETDEDGEFPGADALRGIRANECQMLLASSGLDVDPRTVSGVLTSEVEWYVTGFRTITCDGKPT